MVGRSNIVGLPASLLLLKADATVTIVHSHTSQPESIIREADIVIAAAGQPMMVTNKISYFICLSILSHCTVHVTFQILSRDMDGSYFKMSQIT